MNHGFPFLVLDSPWYEEPGTSLSFRVLDVIEGEVVEGTAMTHLPRTAGWLVGRPFSGYGLPGTIV